MLSRMRLLLVAGDVIVVADALQICTGAIAAIGVGVGVSASGSLLRSRALCVKLRDITTAVQVSLQAQQQRATDSHKH